MLGLARATAFLLAALFTVMTLAAQLAPLQPRDADPRGELFDPELSRVDSIDKAEIWIRAHLSAEPSQAEIAEEIARFMRLRFFHDLATFRFSDDWVAYFAGFAWDDLAAPVRPDDLMKYRRGICTQQAMVFQAILERFGIDYATVGFDNPPHMLVGARIDGTWAIYDSDKEPNRTRLVPFTEALQGDILAELYRGKPGSPQYGFDNDVGLQWQQAVKQGHIEIKNVNVYPAPQAAVFHAVTAFLSHYGWLAFTLLALLIEAAAGRHYPGHARPRPPIPAFAFPSGRIARLKIPAIRSLPVRLSARSG